MFEREKRLVETLKNVGRLEQAKEIEVLIKLGEESSQNMKNVLTSEVENSPAVADCKFSQLLTEHAGLVALVTFMKNSIKNSEVNESEIFPTIVKRIAEIAEEIDRRFDKLNPS